VIPQNGTALPRRTGARDPEEVAVARLEGLSLALDGDPDPAFRAATRARLVAMAAVRTPAPEPASRMRSLLSFRAVDSTPARWRSRVTAGLAGAALTVTALAGLTAVATGAGPGDLLYGLKRGTEQTQLALAADSTRGRTLLDFASTRLDELRALVEDDATALPVAGAVRGTGGDLVARRVGRLGCSAVRRPHRAETGHAVRGLARCRAIARPARRDQHADRRAAHGCRLPLGSSCLRHGRPRAAARDVHRHDPAVGLRRHGFHDRFEQWRRYDRFDIDVDVGPRNRDDARRRDRWRRRAAGVRRFGERDRRRPGSDAARAHPCPAHPVSPGAAPGPDHPEPAQQAARDVARSVRAVDVRQRRLAVPGSRYLHRTDPPRHLLTRALKPGRPPG
jgi:hypothetical protein